MSHSPDPHDPAAVRARLQARRADLARISEGSAAARRPVELDQQSVGRLSRMDALQQQAMSKASDSQRQAEIRRIDAALERLRAGDYGACVRCGEDIADARLALDPAVALCVGCAGR
jgi:DnaK suppressor protein